jgi:PAS domain S-box-containing protein
MAQVEVENKIKDLEDENYRLKEELDYDLFSAREAFRIVVESNLDAIIGIDNNCNIMLFNPAAEEMFQLVEEEVLYKPVEILFKEDVEKGYHSKLVKFLNEGIFERDILNKTTEVLFRKKNGDYFEGETSFAVGRGKSNLYIVLTIRDISERKRLERKLIESEAKARTLLNTPHQAILMIDVKGNILDCNRSCHQLFADNHSDIIGKHISNCRNKNITLDLLSKIEWVFSSGEILRYESKLDREYYDNIIYPVVDQNGVVIQTVMVSNNITDYKQK